MKLFFFKPDETTPKINNKKFFFRDIFYYFKVTETKLEEKLFGCSCVCVGVCEHDTHPLASYLPSLPLPQVKRLCDSYQLIHWCLYSVRGYAFQGGIIKQNCSELFWATRLRDQDLQLTCISHPHWPILPPFPPFLCFNSAQPPVYRQGPPLTTEIPFVTFEEPRLLELRVLPSLPRVS